MTRMETLNIIFSTKKQMYFYTKNIFYRQEKKMRCFIGFIERFIFFLFSGEKKIKKIRKNSAGDIPNTCEEVLMVIKKKRSPDCARR